MKAISLSGLVAVVLASPHAAAVDFVRQTQVVNGSTVVTDQSVVSASGKTKSGTLTSAKMDADLSVFQLWASYTNGSQGTTMLKLDEKTIGTFLPVVTLTTSSEDPAVPTRTRADRPYSVTVKVSGMLDDPSYPDYARRVIVNRGYKQYSPVTYAPTGVVDSYSKTNVYYTNGTYNTSGIYQQLPGASATDAVGAETIAANVQPESNSTTTQLASAEIIVWPVANAVITGIESGKRYYGLPQSGSVTLTNAYPDSTTYAQIYKGAEKLGTAGILIPSSTKQYATTKPQNTTISPLDLQSLSAQLPDDGLYTLEVLTVTPFDGGAPERLAYITFDLHRTITVQSMLSTLE